MIKQITTYDDKENMSIIKEIVLNKYVSYNSYPNVILNYFDKENTSNTECTLKQECNEYLSSLY